MSRALDKEQITIANLGFHKDCSVGMQSSQLVLFLSPISLIAYSRSCCNGRDFVTVANGQRSCIAEWRIMTEIKGKISQLGANRGNHRIV